MGLFEMMIHIADENARELRYRESRETFRVVTVADIETMEWEAFKRRLKKQKSLIGVDDREDVVAGGVEEDDLDMLIALADILENSKHPLTFSEVMYGLQGRKVLSREFTSAARAQTKRLLLKMRELNRVWQDASGRWSKLK